MQERTKFVVTQQQLHLPILPWVVAALHVVCCQAFNTAAPQGSSHFSRAMQPQAYIFDLDGLILDTGG
jgi:hypothetical protein